MAKKKDNKSKIQTYLAADNVTVCANIQEEAIVTTEDKIKIAFTEYNAVHKYSGEFFTFLGIFISILLSITTSNFKSVLGLSAETVEAIFVLSLIISFAICVVSAIKWIRHRKQLSFAYFISQLKGHNNE